MDQVCHDQVLSGGWFVNDNHTARGLTLAASWSWSLLGVMKAQVDDGKIVHSTPAPEGAVRDMGSRRRMR